MTRRAIVSCKNLRLFHILRISNCFEINVNVLNMVSWSLFNSGSLHWFWYWFFKVFRISTMFMEFYSMENEYCSTSLERDTSSLVRQYWIQWTCLDSIIVLLTMMVDYWLFSITILIFHQHGDQRLTVILSWSKWRQMAGLLEQNQRFGFDYFLFARSSKICSW